MSKMSFKIYKKDLKATGELLVVIKFESARSDHDDGLFKTFWIVLSHYRVYSILLKNFNTYYGSWNRHNKDLGRKVKNT